MCQYLVILIHLTGKQKPKMNTVEFDCTIGADDSGGDPFKSKHMTKDTDKTSLI